MGTLGARVLKGQVLPRALEWRGLTRSVRSSLLLASLKIADRVHFLVGDADNINGVAANQVEHDMLAFGKAVVVFANVRLLFVQKGVFCKPLKAGFETFQTVVSRGSAPGALGVAANLVKIVPGARGNSDFSGGLL